MSQSVQSSQRRKAHPLDAVPEIAPGAEVRVDSQGHLQIRRELVPRHPIERTLRKWFAQPAWGRVNLDERGSFFWSQIDGEMRLRELAKCVARRFDLVEKIGVESTLLYTKALMLRGLIVLKIEGAETKKNP